MIIIIKNCNYNIIIIIFMIPDDVLAVSPATECLTQVLPWLAKTMDSIVRFEIRNFSKQTMLI